METVGVMLTCGLLAFLGTCSFLADGDGLAMRTDAWAKALLHRLHRQVARVGDLLPVGRMTQWKPWRAMLTEMGRWNLPERDASLLLACAIIAACLLGGLLSRSVFGMLVVAATAMFALQWHASSVERARAQELAASMPSVLRTLASALASGHTLVQALDYVGIHERGPAAPVFARTSLRLRCGMSTDDALAYLEEELDAPGVGLMATALSIAQRTGSPLQGLLQRSATLVEQEGEYERLLMVRTAQVRMSVRVVCSLPPLMVCLLSLISTDFQHGLATPAGMGSLVLAAAMDGMALLIIRRIMGGIL